MLSLLLSVALFAPPKVKPLAKVPEYDLLPTCVENILVNNVNFHCVVDDIDKPKHIACDAESFKVLLKKNSRVDNCTVIHMIFPKDTQPH